VHALLLVYTEILSTRYVVNHLWAFHQIYNSVQLGTEMNSLDFESEGHGHSEAVDGHVSTLRGISHLCPESIDVS